MIQDIAPLQLDNSYKKKVPHAGSRMLGFGERTVYLEYNGELQFLTYERGRITTKMCLAGRCRHVFIFFPSGRKNTS